jgi:hypothetical protein
MYSKAHYTAATSAYRHDSATRYPHLLYGLSHHHRLCHRFFIEDGIAPIFHFAAL